MSADARSSRRLLSALRAPVLGGVLLLALGSCASGPPPTSTESAEPSTKPANGATAFTRADRAAIIATIQREAAAEHRLERISSGFRGENGALRAVFGANGVEVSADSDGASWRWHAEARRWGCEGELAELAAAKPEAMDNRATYHHAGLDEWYVVGPLGIEQGFTVAAPPECRRGRERGGVEIELATGGLDAKVEPNGAAALLLDEAGHEVLRYSDLYVVDAAGKELHAELRTRAGALAIWFDDREATYPVTVDPLIAAEMAKLLASDSSAGNMFGSSVLVSGDTVFVGAPGDNARRGAVYVIRNTGITWSPVNKLMAAFHEPAEGDLFGASISVSGNTLAIGVPGWDASRGMVYIFVNQTGTWSPDMSFSLTDGAPDDSFGESVALSGDTLVVGSSGYSNHRGAAYVYVRSGLAWSPPQRLTASDTAVNDYFGQSVAVDGDTVIVGAHMKANAEGAAYAFVWSGTTWSEQQKLTASIPQSSDHFGYSVSLSGDTAIIGAKRDAAPGAAHVFVRSGATWSEQKELTADDAGGVDGFGNSVMVRGNTAVVGAESSNAAYLFVRSGVTWSRGQRLGTNDPGIPGWFGHSVAVSENTVVVGTPGWGGSILPSTAPAVPGAAYVFTYRRGSNGEPCTVAAECTSGFCADGVCCDTACDAGPCDACSVALGAEVNGTCTLFSGNACDDGNACTQTDTCQNGVCVGSNPNLCSGQGTCSAPTGTCTCNAGFVGNACQYSDATTCNGHGTAQANGTCTCNAGFAGPSCNACATDYYGYPTCAFCTSATSCAGHGSCSGTGSCICDAGFAGSGCQYSDATTCSGHGTAQADGSCVCTAGYFGAACELSSAACNDHGTPQAGGGCICDAGWVGSACQYSDATTCSGHGTAHADGTCTCAETFSGASCSECAADHYGYPACVPCNAATTCSGHGTCRSDGACECAPGFTGPSCSTCLPDHHGPDCTACIASACPAPSDDCHEAACDANGQCVNAPKPDGTTCANGTCQAGVCTPTPDGGSPDAGTSSSGGAASSSSSGGGASSSSSGGSSTSGGSTSTSSSSGEASGGSSDSTPPDGGGCSIGRASPRSPERGGSSSFLAVVIGAVLRARRKGGAPSTPTPASGGPRSS